MRVAVGGLGFDVRVGGPADGVPVLLLHGFPENARMWDGVAALLDGCRTIAPDQRGYSPAARPPDVAGYRVTELVADAAGILDALGVADAHVIGHDWGAVVGWQLAARRPGRVRSLTAVSVPHPAAHAAAMRTDPEQAEKSRYIAMFRSAGAEERLLADDARRLRRMFGPLPQAEDFVAPLRGPGALTAALNWYRAMSAADLPGPVAVPVTYVWGTEDAAVSRAAAESCASYVTGDFTFVELPGADHWVPEKQPAAVAAAARTRMAATPGGP
jgi:pimeloyl-ACP methyl ester carboxylesterase